MSEKLINETPWDASVFELHTAEIAEYSPAALQQALLTPGHYTVRVDPLASKQLLHEYGFYYCDTLIEPYCAAEKLKALAHPEISIGQNMEWEALLPICHGAFVHSRFHRDFNLDHARADLRCDNWLRQFYERGHVYGLYWRSEMAGFVAYAGNRLVLHAVGNAYRNKGLAKYWWSAVCRELAAAGCPEITSSISASNMAALNLYVSLGFGFRNPTDIYHRLVK